MPILSYLVLPVAGAARRVAQRLSAIPGCEVARSENRDLLILVTETSCEADEQTLQAALAGVEGIHSMSFTFGDVSS